MSDVFDVDWDSHSESGHATGIIVVETGYNVRDDRGDIIDFVPVFAWDTEAETRLAFRKQGWDVTFNEDGTIRTIAKALT